MSAFFWFVAFVVVLILFISKSQKIDRERRTAYWQGRSDERASLSVQPQEQIQVQQPSIQTSQLSVSLQQTQQPPQVSQFNPSWQAQPVPEIKTPEMKEQQTIKNLNIMLYVGSFLIVAATALFVTLTMPAVARLTGIIIVTLGFYISGLVLHKTSVRLKSAAVAFVGTGLAIVPFIGFALTSLGGISSETSWLIASVLGVAAYAFAAIRLQNEFVSYATMAFVISLSLSIVPSLQLSTVWYFISVVGLSTIINLVYLLKPSLLPDIFAKPLQNTGLLITPITLAISVIFPTVIDFRMYELLFGLATLHYLLIAIITKRPVYEMAVRILAQITLCIVALDLVKDFDGRSSLLIMSTVWLGLGLAQAAYSLLRVRLNDQTSRSREQKWIGVSLGLTTLVAPVWLILDDSGLLLATHLAALAILCALSVFKFHKVNWAYGSLASSIILPFVVARMVFEPPLSFEVIALVFAMVGAITLVCLERMVSSGRSVELRRLVLVSLVVFAVMTALSGLLDASSQSVGWTMLAMAVLMIAGSLVVGAVSMEIIGALAVVASIAAWTDELVSSGQWRLTVVAMASVATIGVGVLIHQKYAQTNRRNALAILAAIIPVVLIYNLFSGQLVTQVSTVMLLLMGMGMMAFRVILRNHHQTLRVISLCGYLAYPLLALLLSIFSGIEWVVLVMLGLAVISWVSSYIESIPAVMVVGHIALMTMLFLLWNWLNLASEWRVFGVTWISSGVYYLWYWYSCGRADQQRRQIALWSMSVTLVIPSVYGLFSGVNTWIISSAMSMLAIAAVLAIHGYLVKKSGYYEASIYIATLGLQCIVTTLIPELGLVAYSHWWALTLIAVAWWRGVGRVRLGLGLGFITLPTGIFALIDGSTSGIVYTAVFLVEHLVVALVGALIRKQWVMWWGIIAVLLAVLYFIRSYTFLILLLLGFLLILFVVWRLLKSGHSNTPDKPDETQSV